MTIYILQSTDTNQFQICTYKDDHIYFCGDGGWENTIPADYNRDRLDDEYHPPGWWKKHNDYVNATVVASFSSEEELNEWYDENPEKLI